MVKQVLLTEYVWVCIVPHTTTYS